MRPRSRSWSRVGLVSLLVLGVPASRAATDVVGLLARSQRALEPGKDLQATVTFEIGNAKGDSVSWTGSYYRRSGADVRTRIVFDTPLDLRGTEVALRSLPDGSEQVRTYLPAIRRIRDLSGDARGESFLGTDFNYEDLGLEHLAYREHALLGEDRFDGRTCTDVESIPQQGWWYGKIVRCVDMRTGLPIRTRYYDRSGTLWKVRTFNRIETVDGHPTATRITMETVPLGTWTRITFRDLKYDRGLPATVVELP